MATDRLMATAWRYEQNKGTVNTLRNAQEDKINQHNTYMKNMLSQQNENSKAFKISWANKFDDVNERCRAKNAFHADKEELKLIRRANMMVRRDALAKLFTREYQTYENELNDRGLCIHRELL